MEKYIYELKSEIIYIQVYKSYIYMSATNTLLHGKTSCILNFIWPY